MQMTSILMLGAMAIAGGAVAQDSVPAAQVQPAAKTVPAAKIVPATPAQPVAADQTAEVSAAETMIKQSLALLGDLNASLAGVTDKATADAAASKIGEIKKQMLDMQKASAGQTPPSEEVRKQLEARYSGELMKSVLALNATMKTLVEKKFFGSELLEKTILDMNSGSAE